MVLATGTYSLQSRGSSIITTTTTIIYSGLSPWSLQQVTAKRRSCELLVFRTNATKYKRKRSSPDTPLVSTWRPKRHRAAASSPRKRFYHHHLGDFRRHGSKRLRVQELRGQKRVFIESAKHDAAQDKRHKVYRAKRRQLDDDDHLQPTIIKRIKIA